MLFPGRRNLVVGGIRETEVVKGVAERLSMVIKTD